jgi:phage major head subunit gpT-like protein
MIVAAPSQLLKGLQALFIEQLAAEPESLVAKIATYVSSNSDKEDYAWLGEVAQLEEFVDEVHFEGLSDTNYELRNKKFTGGLQVKRDDLADEKTGGIAMRIRDLASRAARHANKQLIDALINGDVDAPVAQGGGRGYDGVPFFYNAHPARGKQTTTQSNLVTATGTTTAATATDIASALAALINMLDEANEPLNEGAQRFFIVYPPAMQKPIAEAVTAGIIAQTSNVQFSGDSFDLIKQPRLTADDTADYYVGIADTPVRGLVYQDREPVSFEALEDGDEAFKRELYSYKVRKRSVAGYGRWQRLVKVA